jgi:hypothetical protein
MHEDMVGKVEDVATRARDHLPMVKVKRIANSVDEAPRAETSKASEDACCSVRGNASASAPSAERQMVKKRQAQGRKESIL